MAPLRLLADENVPGPSVAALRVAGHDVAWAAESTPGAADGAVLARAAAEGRVLVTLDRDFGELLFRRVAEAPPAGVVYFRDVPPDPEYVARLLLDLADARGVALVAQFTAVHSGRRPRDSAAAAARRLGTPRPWRLTKRCSRRAHCGARPAAALLVRSQLSFRR